VSSADAYFATATQLLARAREVNAPTLRRCGALIGANVAEGGVLHTFGSGHREIIGREDALRMVLIGIDRFKLHDGFEAMRRMRESDFSMSTFPSSSSSVMESIMYRRRLMRFACCGIGWVAWHVSGGDEKDEQANNKNTLAPTSSSPMPPIAPIICPMPGSMPLTFDMGPIFIT
jgi:hypothetical protein